MAKEGRKTRGNGEVIRVLRVLAVNIFSLNYQTEDGGHPPEVRQGKDQNPEFIRALRCFGRFTDSEADYTY